MGLRRAKSVAQLFSRNDAQRRAPQQNTQSEGLLPATHASKSLERLPKNEGGRARWAPRGGEHSTLGPRRRLHVQRGFAVLRPWAAPPPYAMVVEQPPPLSLHFPASIAQPPLCRAPRSLCSASFASSAREHGGNVGRVRLCPAIRGRGSQSKSVVEVPATTA